MVTKVFNKSRSPKLFPKYQASLIQLGENIKLASKRRKFTQILLSQRTGLSRMTIRKIMNGDPNVAIGYYAMVLGVLGLEQDFRDIALGDELGRKLQDIELLRKKQR